jgi:hypothetical protein
MDKSQPNLLTNFPATNISNDPDQTRTISTTSLAQGRSRQGDLQFEYTVCELIKQATKGLENTQAKFDKHKMLDSDSYDRSLVRKDGKNSNPDAIVFCEEKVVVIDAKFYQTELPKKEIDKLLGDSKLRNGCPPIVVLPKDGTLSNPAYEACLRNRVIILRLEEATGTGQSNAKNIFDDKLLNSNNIDLVQNAIQSSLIPIPKTSVLFTKNGELDKRCYAYTHGEDLNQLGVVLDQNGKVDKNCEAYKKFETYVDSLSKKKQASNYVHKEARENYQSRKKMNSDSNSKEEVKSQEESKAAQTSQHNISNKKQE